MPGSETMHQRVVRQVLSLYGLQRVRELINGLELANLEAELCDQLELGARPELVEGMFLEVLVVVAEHMALTPVAGSLPWKTISADVNGVLGRLDELEGTIDSSSDWTWGFLLEGDAEIEGSLAVLRKNAERILSYCSGRDGRGRTRNDVLTSTIDRLLLTFFRFGGGQVLNNLDNEYLSNGMKPPRSYKDKVFEFVELPLTAAGIEFSENEAKRQIGHQLPSLRNEFLI